MGAIAANDETSGETGMATVPPNGRDHEVAVLAPDGKIRDLDLRRILSAMRDLGTETSTYVSRCRKIRCWRSSPMRSTPSPK